MSILAKISAPPRTKAATNYSQGFTTTDTEMVRRALGNASSSGQSVNESSVMGISAAWCCMRIISEAIGTMPWAVFEGDGPNATQVKDHDLAYVLTQSPNIDQTPVEIKESTGLKLCQCGNAYAWRETLGDKVTSITPIEAPVTPKRKQGSNTRLNIPDGSVFYQVTERGKTEDYPREKIWQVRGFGSNGLVGLSPIGAAREALGFSLALEAYGNAFFRQGAMPAGFVSYPGFLEPEQKKDAQEALDRLVGGLGNAFKMALFQGAMKPEPWGEMPLEDMQFVLLRGFSVLEVARFYRIPPHMLAEMTKGVSYSSIEMLSQEFVMFTLMPYFTRIEASVQKWLLRPADRGKYFVRFNYEGLLRADAKGRSEFYANALQNGYMNRNEVRAKENLARVDGLDGFTAQVNLAPVEMLGRIQPSGGA